MDHCARPKLYCDHCGNRVLECLFDISVSRECVEYAEPMSVVDIMSQVTVADFCSKSCRDDGCDVVMARYGVPVRSPDIGPIEVCACCGAPVDMAEFHITFTANDLDVLSPTEMRQLDTAYLAVVCRACEGEVTRRHEAQWGEPDGGPPSVAPP